MFGQQQQGGGLFGSALAKPSGGGLFSSATTAPAFGASTTTTSSSLFGTQPATSGGLFGAKPTGSIFGATTTQAQPSGGLFGQQQQAPSAGFSGGGLFGPKPAVSAFGQASQPSMFGQTQPQQSITGGLFGAAAPSTGTFGATTTTASNIFGATTAPFGQQQQQAQSGALFGGAQSTFSGNTFGVTSQSQPSTGTNVVKFTPPTGSDTMQLKGTQTTVTTKQMCVSAMKEYESRSLEELRVADYLAGRKINTAAPSAAAAGTNIFGQQQGGTGGLFGSPLARPVGGGLFTNATAAPAFGTSTATTSSSLFGTQPATSGGLFGAKPTGSIFGATTTQAQPSGGLFGQQQQAPSAGFSGGGLFGPKPAVSAFGQVSQPSMFGQTQPQQSITGGLFGAAAPSTGTFGATTTTTTQGLFGAMAAPFGQQQTQPQTGSLFGAKPATQQTFGAFGAGQQPTFGGQTAGTSLFGANAAPKLGGGLFGTQPQQTQGGGLFGSVGSSLMQKPGQMFGATPQQQVGGGGLFGSTQQTFGSPHTIGMGGSPPIMLGSNVNISGIQQAIIEAQLSTLPYGDSPLLKNNSISPRKSPQDISSLQKQLQLGTSRRIQEKLLMSPPNNGTLMATAADALNATKETTNADLNGSLLDSSFSYKPMVILPSVGFGAALGLHQSPKLSKSRSSEKSLLPEKSSFLNRTHPEEGRSIKSLDMSVVLGEESRTAAETPPQGMGVLTPNPLLRIEAPPATTPEQFPPQPIFDNSSISQPSLPPPFQHPQQQQQQQNPNQIAAPPLPPQSPPKKYRVKMTRPEYYSEPPLDQLEEMFNAEGICRLEGGLTIGRLGYGSVFWKGPVELREPVDFDEIVHFRNKEVVVYPDESKKPDIGKGLNKQAEVSLERIWPIDPKTKQLIKDADELRRIGFREKLERLSQRMDANFRDYQPSTGTWQFEVQHFSKYGFLDDEDEPSMDTSSSSQEELKQQVHMQTLVQKAKVPLREIQKSLEGTKGPPAQEFATHQQQLAGNSSKRALEEAEESAEGQRETSFNIEAYTRMLNEDIKLFEDETIRKKFKFDDTLFDSNKLLESVMEKDEKSAGSKRRPQLIERLPKNVFKGITSLHISSSVLARASIQLQRRTCRVGFTEGLVFSAISPGTHENVVNIYRASIIPTLKQCFLRFIRSRGGPEEQRQLLEELNSSELIIFDPPSPLLRFLDKFVVASHENGEVNIDEAISGICSILLMKADSIEGKIAQRVRMGDWLRAQLASKMPAKSSSFFALVFHHLVNGSIREAIAAAHKSHHYNLALLLSLYKTPGSHLVREQASRQLALMSRRSSDPDYVKMLELLSGEWTRGGCLAGLDWLQILGVLIWYHVSPTTTLVECMDALEELMAK